MPGGSLADLIVRVAGAGRVALSKLLDHRVRPQQHRLRDRTERVLSRENVDGVARRPARHWVTTTTGTPSGSAVADAFVKSVKRARLLENLEPVSAPRLRPRADPHPARDPGRHGFTSGRSRSCPDGATRHSRPGVEDRVRRRRQPESEDGRGLSDLPIVRTRRTRRRARACNGGGASLGAPAT